jgi:predicted short-subunit dehydrogenase-like oxidoreductase (DUF2520 family)
MRGMTSDAPIPSLDLVQRTLAVDVSYTISRMQVLERIPGNPICIGGHRRCAHHPAATAAANFAKKSSASFFAVPCTSR